MSTDIEIKQTVGGWWVTWVADGIAQVQHRQTFTEVTFLVEEFLL